MVRRRMRRIELARPTRDAVDVRESTWLLISLLSRTAACWAACAALVALVTAGIGPERRGSGAGVGSGLSGRSTVCPRFGMTQRIITENRCSVKWHVWPTLPVQARRCPPALVRWTNQPANGEEHRRPFGSPREPNGERSRSPTDRRFIGRTVQRTATAPTARWFIERATWAGTAVWGSIVLPSARPASTCRPKQGRFQRTFRNGP